MVSFSKFFSSPVLIGFAVAVAAAERAPVIDDNPDKAIYKADLDGNNIHGIVELYTARNGSTKVHVDITGLPEDGGPFYYHIHNNQISNNDCETAGTHFNPYGAEFDDCDEAGVDQDDSYCQIGDLSGKHGFINTTCFQLDYYDPYISLNRDNKAYIGDRSIVVHYNDLSKMVCGNIRESKSKFWKMEYLEEDDTNSTSYFANTTYYAINASNATDTNSTGYDETTTTYEDTAIRVAAGALGTLIGLLVAIF